MAEYEDNKQNILGRRDMERPLVGLNNYFDQTTTDVSARSFSPLISPSKSL